MGSEQKQATLAQVRERAKNRCEFCVESGGAALRSAEIRPSSSRVNLEPTARIGWGGGDWEAG